ncbi:MAG: glucose-1-phosphate cytidylyltransferase [Candidatus Omnitrophica bacterium]|nr:glucose-1-phosphate cytidylyltransferase [Candidatus Omnitrophota bacterium]
MKVVILCGGLGTRLSEETNTIPKPMIEIGGKPILWHIMKIFSHYGFNDFVICLGYRGYLIKEYFSHYLLHMSDVTIDMVNNKMDIHSSTSEPWKVTLVDTGIGTMTGGRIKRIQKYIGKETFMLTYGDGVADIDINKLVKTHKRNKKLATLTGVLTAGRFGVLDIQKDSVKSFMEKPKGEGNRINGGFFVLEPEIFNYIKKGDATIWERDPLRKLAADGNLVVYKHNGFWKCMDTLRDKVELEEMIEKNEVPWKKWR